MSTEATKVVGQYTRSRGGAVVHWEPCPLRGQRSSWNYAAQMSVHEVAAVAQRHGLTLCARCWPAEAREV